MLKQMGIARQQGKTGKGRRKHSRSLESSLGMLEELAQLLVVTYIFL